MLHKQCDYSLFSAKIRELTTGLAATPFINNSVYLLAHMVL